VQQTVALGRPCDVVCRPSAALAAECHVRIEGRRNLARIALDRPGARRAAERRPSAVVADEKQCLSGIVRIRTWLAHELSSYSKRRCAVGVACEVDVLTAIH
jgi:hypothetical protein